MLLFGMANPTQQEKEYLFFSNPQTITLICRHVAQGGSLIDLADMVDIRYCDIMQWIRRDVDLDKQYKAALEDRKEWAREKLLLELNNISYKQSEEIDGTPVKAQVRDRLKAIEMLMKNLSMLTEKHEVTGTVTLDSLIMATQKKIE